MDPIRYVAVLARAVDVLRRSGDPGEPQMAAMAALVDLTASQSATLRYYDGVLTVDNVVVATNDPRLASFPDRLAAQSIAEISIARGAEPAELLALASGLGAAPGQGRIKEKLRDASSTRVMVVTVQPIDGSRVPLTISGAFAKVKADEATLREWNRFLNQGATSSAEKTVDVGLRAQGSGEIQIDIGAADPAITIAPRMAIPAAAEPAVPEAPAAAEPPPAAPAAPAQPAAPAPAAPIPPAAPAPAAKPLPQPPTLQVSSPLGTAMAKLLSDPFGTDTLAKLTQVTRQVQDAFTQDRVAEAIDACNTIIELESRAPEPARSTYGVLLRRILTHSALGHVAPYLLEPRRRDRARVVMKRAGEEGVGLLVGLLASAQTLGERMTYLEVLRGVPTGVDRVLALLGRSEWQVVRNAAELAGEARLEESVGYLSRLLDHGDERVRRVAIASLAKLGTVMTVEPLRMVLRTGTPEMRALVAANVTGPHARPLTGPLAAVAEQDDNADVIRACYQALGRIGTAEAKQALERAAAHKSLFSRRAKVAREAAEEVLKSLGTRTS